MDKNIFEDRILAYLDGSMDFKERKEFEDLLNHNDSYKSLVNDIKNNISLMKKAEPLKVSKNFEERLQLRIESLSFSNDGKKSFFSSYPRQWIFSGLSVFGILVLTFLFFQPNSNLIVVDENIQNEQKNIIDSPSKNSNDEQIKELDQLDNFNGSFVNDKQ